MYNCITLSLSKSKNKKRVQVKHLTFRMFQKTVTLKFWITWTLWKTCLISLAHNFIPMKLTGLLADKQSYMYSFFNLLFCPCPIFDGWYMRNVLFSCDEYTLNLSYYQSLEIHVSVAVTLQFSWYHSYLTFMRSCVQKHAGYPNAGFVLVYLGLSRHTPE